MVILVLLEELVKWFVLVCSLVVKGVSIRTVVKVLRVGVAHLVVDIDVEELVRIFAIVLVDVHVVHI